MERQLPIYTIEGTDFIVDVNRLVLQEKAHPENCIELFYPNQAIRDVGDGYVMDYDPLSKQPALVWELPGMIPIKLPELVALDPVGMAEKFGCTIEALDSKTDFEVMVDQDALAHRLAGNLPVLKIYGQVFTVDINEGRLQLKENTASKGIVFKELRNYCDRDADTYTIPYNPQTQEFQEPDYATLTELPKDLVVISFPHESILDPVGFNRYHGFEDGYQLKAIGVRAHFEAREGNWKQLISEKTLLENRRKQQEERRLQPQQNNRIQKGIRR